MKRGVSGICALFCLLALVWAAPARAHHSVTAEFDPTKSFTLTGTITKIDWVNPHVYLYADVKDDKGNIDHFSLECLPPGLLRRGGVIRTMFNVGDTVTFDVYGPKDGSKHLAYVNGVHFADGRSILLTRAATGNEKLQ